MNAASLVWHGVVVCVVGMLFGQPAQADPTTRSSDLHHRVVFEAAYKLGARYTLRSPTEAKAEAEAIGLWNVGGRAGAWHPHPRVVVDNVRGVAASPSAAILKTARAKGYWPIRRCYDPALVGQPTLRGTVSVRLTIDASGSVVRSSVVGKPTLADPQVAACIRDGMRGVSYPKVLAKTAEVTIDVMVNPGDAPVKGVEDPVVLPGPGVVDLAVVQALVVGHAGAAIQQCYSEAAERVPGLWGRMVLRLDVAPNGAIREVVETDSTFPDVKTTTCTVEEIRKVGLPPPMHGDVRVVLPIRFSRSLEGR